MSFTLEDITKVTKISSYEMAVVNETHLVLFGSDEWEILEQYKEQEELESFEDVPNAAEQAVAAEAVAYQDKRVFLHKWREAGAQILEKVDIILLDKLPTPAQGLANLEALRLVENLLLRGNLNVAKAALEAADLTGTSFEGDSDSFNEIMAMIDDKIAELTP